MSMSTDFVKCSKCGHKAWVNNYSSDENDGYRPSACPKCSGGWVPCDPADSEKKHGDLKRCGRCQGTFAWTDAWVTNAPKEMHNSWCAPCIQKVNEGENALIPGISIDRDGFVIANSRNAQSSGADPFDALPKDILFLVFGWILIGAGTLWGVATIGAFFNFAPENRMKLPGAIISFLLFVLPLVWGGRALLRITKGKTKGSGVDSD